MLAELHKHQIIYNHVSPENICVSENSNSKNLYFTNFENAVKKKIIIDSKKVFFQNRFGSKNSHFGIFPSFRDDIESLIYMLTYFLKGGEFLKQENNEDLKNFKLTFIIEDLFPIVPEELIIIFNYITKIGFDELPSMSFISNILFKYFLKNDLEPFSLKYDWCHKFEEIDKEEERQLLKKEAEDEISEMLFNKG